MKTLWRKQWVERVSFWFLVFPNLLDKKIFLSHFFKDHFFVKDDFFLLQSTISHNQSFHLLFHWNVIFFLLHFSFLFRLFSKRFLRFTLMTDFHVNAMSCLVTLVTSRRNNIFVVTTFFRFLGTHWWENIFLL